MQIDILVDGVKTEFPHYEIDWIEGANGSGENILISFIDLEDDVYKKYIENSEADNFTLAFNKKNNLLILAYIKQGFQIALSLDGLEELSTYFENGVSIFIRFVDKKNTSSELIGFKRT